VRRRKEAGRNEMNEGTRARRQNEHEAEREQVEELTDRETEEPPPRRPAPFVAEQIGRRMEGTKQCLRYQAYGIYWDSTQTE